MWSIGVIKQGLTYKQFKCIYIEKNTHMHTQKRVKTVFENINWQGEQKQQIMWTSIKNGN